MILGKAAIVADTASRMKRHPDWWPIPRGPENPLGTQATFPSRSACIFHRAHVTGKIGRRSPDCCIGLFNKDDAELFDLCPLGTRVRAI